MEIIEWEYAGKRYSTRQSLQKTFGWSSSKFRAKLADGKIIKININEDKSNENNKYIQ